MSDEPLGDEKGPASAKLVGPCPLCAGRGEVTRQVAWGVFIVDHNGWFEVVSCWQCGGTGRAELTSPTWAESKTDDT